MGMRQDALADLSKSISTLGGSFGFSLSLRLLVRLGLVRSLRLVAASLSLAAPAYLVSFAFSSSLSGASGEATSF